MATKINPAKSASPTLGVIYGNRDFFPGQLVTKARAESDKMNSIHP